MNANLAPPVTAIKPWASKTTPLVSFLCDDGTLYQSQFQHLSTTSPTPAQLDIKAPPHGYIVVTGPEVRELCLALESQKATMIRTDRVALTSVKRLTEQDYAMQQIEAARPPEEPDPDLNEVD